MAGVVDGLSYGRGVAILGSNREQSRVLKPANGSFQLDHGFAGQNLYVTLGRSTNGLKFIHIGSFFANYVQIKTVNEVSN